ncbi:MAG TPA: PIN domain-containing protein [Dehalococcoidia bacterium]|nr:PIN domain-containing protein [Dehalococcoidia bacterium]
MSVDFFFRFSGMVVLTVVGYQLGEYLAGPQREPLTNRTILALALTGMALGLLVTPYVTVRPFRWVRQQIKQLPANVLLAGTIGLILALIVSALLSFPLSLLPGELGKWLPLGAATCISYLGVSIMVMREKDMIQAMGAFLPAPLQNQRWSQNGTNQVILDTSAIIDGRIADISQTGFLQGTLVLPRFVLDELRHIADSPDVLRRNRGRRGLEMLNKLQKDAPVPIHISDVDYEGAFEVDAKLIKLAKTLHAPIITNDFNLNRVAELQGVRALNVNELANAVKSVVLPGEEMQVRVIQEGKELGQGVAFLDDGTMVVVENGRRHVGHQIPIIVTRVLQTVAGRMIFAQLKGEQQV